MIQHPERNPEGHRAHSRDKLSGGRTIRHHATTDHIFDSDETEFLAAIEEFKEASGKKFPTWTDALRVMKSLGYCKPHE